MTNREHEIKSIEIIGLCTDICVIANAILLKTHSSDTSIFVDAKCYVSVL
ncbi:hypothetical protein [Thomasclavelia sp.]|nr:hypothetical protein [Thomasclavelia sp.]